MHLGVSYCVFSGLELLKPSLLNIRPFADYIAVVWSDISSTGEKAPSYTLPLLNSLVEEHLIDELIEFHPKIVSDPQQMQDNCRLKREIGRLACLQAGCTQHLIRDCDEFHNPIQLKNVLDHYPDVDCSLTLIHEYVYNPVTKVKQTSGLYVPFLQKIDKRLQPRMRPFGVMCDGGRTVANVKSWRIYQESELVLHHYTFVRYNEEEMKRKYQGHGHCHRVGTLDKFLNWTKRFRPEELENVPDTFGIQKYWDEEFQQWLK